ncbi:nickel-dependent hydrogenase large subunit [Marinisporobacter balticus]|uniref:Hydrogenase large subunit n=1 Tax=Marinisporobacter balticus TaxID=2018667 RepID=A0A4V2SB94_9FIRM|nr:nickel-dependent hydrogenase large subunit [Marinisporobacter balticus]TCO74630.1 hydrogenase large subunit [Marinisporobacter balticus]
MGEKIVINPLTRISGFLEIEVYIENHIIKNAKSSGMLFRGFEKMLEGRPPLDAIYFTQRICGICSTAHSIASALALEDALKVVPNENDRMIRDMIHGCEFLQNHLRHFYQYTFPDYVKGPQINPLYKESHGDYRLPKIVDEKLSKHYIASIEYSRQAHKMLAILGGKAPHNHGVFVGGVTVNMNASIFIELKSIIASIKGFIENIMIEDVGIIAKYYSDYFHNGKGYGNFISYGVFDDDYNAPFIYVKPAVLRNDKRYPFDDKKITENIYYAWYKADQVNISPKEGYVETDRYKENAYSFIKAPRYDESPMEVGPLARLWLSGEYTRGVSTMDRTIARVLEAKKICNIIENLLTKIRLGPSNQQRYEIPNRAYGIGLKGTTRGALGHWLFIENQKIKKYTIITPTSWNTSPMDSNGVKGVIEKALIGTYVKDVKNPVEVGRIVRSFDPCVSCATHIMSNKYNSMTIRIV